MRDASLLTCALQLLMMMMSAVVLAQVAMVVPSPSSASTSSSSMATDATAITSAAEQELIRASLREWYTSNFYENETQLLGLPNNRTAGLSPSEKPCPQLLSLQTRSSTIAPNKRCPDKFTNLSCTCLTSYVRAGLNEFWEFKVRKKTSMMDLPKLRDAMDVLEIDAIATIWAPGTLKGLRINGTSSEPLPIYFVPENRAGAANDLPIARSESTAFDLQTVEIYNIDMGTVVTNSANFIPLTVTKVIMRNCNLKSYGLRFSQTLMNVQYLDFSYNKLDFPLAGSNTTGDCAVCALRTLNLENNLLKNIPDYIFQNVKNLENLYLAGNALDYNISKTVFDGITKLANFTADGPDSSATCASGKLLTAHNVKFCVLSDAALSAGVDANESSKSTSLMLCIVVTCSVVVAALALIVFWQRWRRVRSNSLKDDDAAFVNTLDFEETHNSSHALLLNDPLLITNRIQFKDLRVGNCISKGGFGLVFVGSFNGRKVAVKKIRPELSDDMTQIELFLKEITLMATLVHPRIVEFVGVAWDSLRNLSAATEFMERGDLRDVLYGFKERGCRLTWSNHKTPVALHIAEALTYLHSLQPKKVIHRDLKSKNVLMNADMEAKLSDFGISRERRFEETHMTAGIGTSFWIAPEVLLGHDYDERADIFSFGVVLCEIDTDDYPYWNDKNPVKGGKLQQAEILRQVASGALRPTFSDDCPMPILSLADRCLQTNPEDRPSAAEIVDELEQIMRA